MRLEVGDFEPLIDEPVGFRVTNLVPGERVVVRVSWETKGVPVVAEGQYLADRYGDVDPASGASFAGTYTGVDPFGLWWSARPSRGEVPRPAGLATIPTRVDALVAVGERATATLRRRALARHATATPVRGGLVGVFFRPPGSGPFPAVVVLGGSEGALVGADLKAALLASHGIAALALAYFGAEGRPTELVDVPLEYAREGLRWLDRHPDVTTGAVGVVGGSRGAELALLLATTFREVRCVVACAPSNVAWGGVGPTVASGAPAWTLGGRPIPPVKPWRPELLDEVYATEPVRLRRLADDVLADDEAVRVAEIPIERTAGPVLLISGEDDEMWPSTRMADALLRRAELEEPRYPTSHLHYAGAGHLCGSPPGLPLPGEVVLAAGGGRRFSLGGTPRGNAAACADSWRQTLEFLGRSLAATGQPLIGRGEARWAGRQSTP